MEQTELQPSISSAPENVIAEYYDGYLDVQQDIFQTERRKTRNTLFIVAALLFGSDLLTLLMANTLSSATFFYILAVPVVFVAIGFFSTKQPLGAVIISMLLYGSLWAITVFAYGASYLLSGLIVKAIIVFFLLAGFGNAREAEKAKKNLNAAKR